MESVLLAVLCLSGWFILPSCPLHQYHFVNQPLTWHEAQAYCRERYTDLATIESMTEVNELIDIVSSSGYNSDVWIGLYTEIDWKWSDGFTGSGSDYRKWEISEPFFLIGQYCVMFHDKGHWYNTDCGREHEFMCYNGTQLDPEFVAVNKKMTWSNAQKYCRENFIDLATVRNDTENQEIHNIMSGLTWAWIGLSRDPNFHWSDGSSFSFTHWNDDFNTYGLRRVICGLAVLQSSGTWRFLYCDETLPFVCYSQPEVKKQLVKLRIELDDPSVDPNDPAVKADLLKKLQDRLKEEGVSGVTLKWREQPDGKVCHKEDPSVTLPAC